MRSSSPLGAVDDPSEPGRARNHAELRLLEVRQRGRQRPQRPQRVARGAEHAAGEHAQGARRELVVAPGRRRLDYADLRREVEQQAEDLGARHAVDDRVMDLREHGDVARAQAADDVQLPQRLGAVQRPRHDPRDLLGELLVASRRGQAELAHVEVQVEVEVVDPVGIVEAERHLLQAPAQRRQQRQALGDQRLDVGEREVPGRRRRRVEDRDARDVPALARRLEREELRVEARQLAHRSTATIREVARPGPGRSCPAPVLAVTARLGLGLPEKTVDRRLRHGRQLPAVLDMPAWCGGNDLRRQDPTESRPPSRGRPRRLVRCQCVLPCARSGRTAMELLSRSLPRHHEVATLELDVEYRPVSLRYRPTCPYSGATPLGVSAPAASGLVSERSAAATSLAETLSGWWQAARWPLA
jgi:hypothetical protein